MGALPDVFSELEINFFLLRRLLGVRSKEGEKQSKVEKLSKTEVSTWLLLPGWRSVPKPTACCIMKASLCLQIGCLWQSVFGPIACYVLKACCVEK